MYNVPCVYLSANSPLWKPNIRSPLFDAGKQKIGNMILPLKKQSALIKKNLGNILGVGEMLHIQFL